MTSSRLAAVWVAVWVGVGAGCNSGVTDPGKRVEVRVERSVDKVDLLFVIEDTTSPMQNELKARLPQLIKLLDDYGRDRPVSYHFGVITTDMGAGPFTLGGGQCHPGGRGGKLQPVGAAADAGCLPPTRGLNFIDYNQLDNTNNLPTGQDLAKSFSCMASVGSKGCGFEQPLEAVYRALHDPPVENDGFLRADALLVVFFLMEEDDCSTDPDSDLFDPDPARIEEYGPLRSYRCSRWGVMCDGELMPQGHSGGPLNNCTAATAAAGGKLIEIDKYIDLFRKSATEGGAKVDPADVTLIGSTGPSAPVSTQLVTPCVGCAQETWLNHSCIAQMNTQFVADPAVRLNQVISAIPSHELTSSCATSYQSTLEGIGERIVTGVQDPRRCIGVTLRDASKPDCVVEDVTQNVDGSTTASAVPLCSASAAATPCWRLDSEPECVMGSPFTLRIDRGAGGSPPTDSVPRAKCTVR